MKISALADTTLWMDAGDVKKLREALGLSQRAFARALKVSNMTVLRAELRGPSRELVLLINAALADGSLKLSDRKAKPE